MKCPKCAAASRVKATRAYQITMLRRTRECFNGHTFSTIEVFPGNVDRRSLAATQRGITARKGIAKRRSVIAANPHLTATQLAADLGCTEARVRQIRSEL